MSGTRADRPQLAAVVEFAREGDVLVTARSSGAIHAPASVHRHRSLIDRSQIPSQTVAESWLLTVVHGGVPIVTPWRPGTEDHPDRLMARVDEVMCAQQWSRSPTQSST